MINSETKLLENRGGVYFAFYVAFTLLGTLWVFGKASEPRRSLRSSLIIRSCLSGNGPQLWGLPGPSWSLLFANRPLFREKLLSIKATLDIISVCIHYEYSLNFKLCVYNCLFFLTPFYQSANTNNVLIFVRD